MKIQKAIDKERFACYNTSIMRYYGGLRMKKILKMLLALTSCLALAFSMASCALKFGEEIELCEKESWENSFEYIEDEEDVTPDPDNPGEGGGEDPDNPGEGGGEDPDNPGESGGEDPENPGEGGGEDPDNPGEGGGEDPDNPGEGGGEDPDNPVEGGGEDPEPIVPVVLGTPRLNYSDGKISWFAIEGVEYYEYKFTWSGDSLTTKDTEIDMGTNTRFYVRAVGDGERYITGEWAYYEKRTPDKLTVNGVVINNDGLVTWKKNEYAVKYVYKLSEDGETLDSDGSGVLLNKGDFIWIKAVGNGTSHIDSDWVSYQYVGPGSGEDNPFV